MVYIFEMGQHGAIFQTRNGDTLRTSKKNQFPEQCQIPAAHELTKLTLLITPGLWLK